MKIKARKGNIKASNVEGQQGARAYLIRLTHVTEEREAGRAGSTVLVVLRLAGAGWRARTWKAPACLPGPLPSMPGLQQLARSG